MKSIEKELKKCKFHPVCMLLMLFISYTSFSQRYISGCVTDAEDGNSIPAVTVFIANTTAGITTDLEGNYRLKIPGEGSYRLVISHVGYQSVSMEIKPGKNSVEFNVALQIQELDEVAVSAGIRFRPKDINLFWTTVFGRNPSPRTIRTTNPEAVYYYYNAETRILKVICREPLQIVNYETGYHINLILNHFIHDYRTGVTDWSYQYVFTELEPATDRQKKSWEKKRKEVYDVSISKFIKSLYNNSLLNDGFVLATLRETSNPRIPFQITLLNSDNKLLTNSDDNSKTLNLSDERILLICYGRPVAEYDLTMLERAQISGSGLFRNMLLGDSIRVFPDGTYANQLHMSPVNLSKTLLGLSMRLPVEYIPEESISY